MLDVRTSTPMKGKYVLRAVVVNRCFVTGGLFIAVRSVRTVYMGYMVYAVFVILTAMSES